MVGSQPANWPIAHFGLFQPMFLVKLGVSVRSEHVYVLKAIRTDLRVKIGEKMRTNQP